LVYFSVNLNLDSPDFLRIRFESSLAQLILIVPTLKSTRNFFPHHFAIDETILSLDLYLVLHLLMLHLEMSLQEKLSSKIKDKNR